MEYAATDLRVNEHELEIEVYGRMRVRLWQQGTTTYLQWLTGRLATYPVRTITDHPTPPPDFMVIQPERKAEAVDLNPTSPLDRAIQAYRAWLTTHASTTTE